MSSSPSAIAQEQKKKPATRVVVDTVRSEPFSQTVPILGRFVARRSGDVAARINGAIEKFHVNVGDRVKTGDVIAVLDKDRLKWERDLKRAEVAHSAAQLKTKKQEVELLRQELRRLQSLKNSPAFSQARLDDKLQQIAVSESAAGEANAQLSMARANQHLSDISLQDAEIKAPHAGIITKRHTSEGAYVAVGAPVVALLDDETMEIEADIPATYIAGLVPGTEISAVIDKSHRISAQVRAVIPEENPRTRTRAVRFASVSSLNSLAGEFAANQSIMLNVPAGVSKTVLTVHKDAVISRKGKYVVVLAIDGKAQMRSVVLGPQTASRFIVEKGLKAGDLVVVRGNERLLPGASISFTTPSPATGTDGAEQPKKADGS